jgi:hypothetical protein
MPYVINIKILTCPMWTAELEVVRDFHRDLAAELAEAGDHAGAVQVRDRAEHIELALTLGRWCRERAQ